MFTTDLLKSVDKQSYELVAASLGIDLQLVVYDAKLKLAEQVRGDDFVVLDEADQILLDHAETLPNSHVLALSATPYSQSKVIEKEYLERQGRFKLIDSMISGSIEWRTATDTVDMHRFMGASEGYARLIYCAESQKLPAGVCATDTNCRDLAKLK